MTQVLLFLIFLAPTIQYRVELPGFSFAVMEPVVLAASAILILGSRARKQPLVIPRTWPEIGLIAIGVWAILVRPWSSDWKHGLSDIRDWVIPIITFLTLLATVRHGWRNAVQILLAMIVLPIFVGIVQRATGGFRPFISPEASLKATPESEPLPGEDWIPGRGLHVCGYFENRALLSEIGALPEDAALAAPETRQAPGFALGFFAHPNSLGMMLAAGGMLAMGWALERRKVEEWIVPVVVSLALYWTYDKTAYAFLLVEIGAYFFLRRIHSLKAVAAVVLVSTIAACLVFSRLPASLLLTLCWRYGLWTTAFHQLSTAPLVLLVGNGMDAFRGLAYYSQPHNTYIYALLEYGLLGLAVVLGVVAWVAVAGWRDRRGGLWERDCVLPAMWLATLAFFAIGLTESVLMGVEQRMIVLNFLACYLGLRQEARGLADSSTSDQARS